MKLDTKCRFFKSSNAGYIKWLTLIANQISLLFREKKNTQIII